MATIEPFTIAIPDEALTDLKRRLQATRWPEREPVTDWSQGVPLEQVQRLCAYWRDQYDWRRCEAMLNGYPQFKTEIDGLGIHFLHVRSPEPGAMPLLLTHGWPGSIIEFHKVIGPLTDPVAHGGKASDAFHLVIPSLPGYGFSDKPEATGYNVGHIAEMWLSLMKRLGYDLFVAQGGDWGATVTIALGALAPPECLAIHLNMVVVYPDAEQMIDMTDREKSAAAGMKFYADHDSGYAKQQGTRPQTLGYGLTDSPAGQAAWIYEKFHAWSDCDSDPLNILNYDEILDNIMLYWLTETATSSARLYWETITGGYSPSTVHIPTGCSIFPKEIFRPSRRWAEQRYTNIAHWNELDRGGHFAAFEQPALFVEEVRTCFRQFR
jgi:pimeloyl-ACP methyl ester carboxylesterase